MDSQTLKPRLATMWLGGCSGCHMSFLDMDERLIDLAARVELCWSPLVDIKEFPNVDVTLVEGAVANESHVHELEIVRKRSRLVVAFGDCAVTGNVTAMRNGFGVDDVLTRAYQSTSAIVSGVPDGSDGEVPRLLPRVRPLHEVIKVDYFLQGCPPRADEIYGFLTALLEGRTPPIRRFG